MGEGEGGGRNLLSSRNTANWRTACGIIQCNSTVSHFQQSEDRILTNTDTVQARQQDTSNSYHSGLWSVVELAREQQNTYLHFFH